jgi:hypothetical protein
VYTVECNAGLALLSPVDGTSLGRNSKVTALLYGVPLVSTRRTVQVPTELMVSFSAIVMSPLAGTDVTVQVVTPITGIPRPSDESARVQAPPWSVTMSPARKSMRLVEPTCGRCAVSTRSVQFAVASTPE